MLESIADVTGVLLTVARVVFWVAAAVLMLVLIRTTASKKKKKKKKSSLASLFKMGSDDTTDVEFEEDLNAWRYYPGTVIRRVTARSELSEEDSASEGRAIKALRESAKQAKKGKDEDEKRKAIAVVSFDASERGHDEGDFAQLVDEVKLNHEKGKLCGVVATIYSPGGSVSEYGFLFSQMERLRAIDPELTVCIDEIGASGGYLAALPAKRIVAAPFSIVGSVGVVSQVLNVYDTLRQLMVDPRMYVAGDKKRLVTATQPIEDDQEKHYQDKILKIHEQFLACLRKYRPKANVHEIKSADHWTAAESVDLELGLVDELGTSSDVLFDLNQDNDLLYFGKPESPAATLLSGIAARTTSVLMRKAHLSLTGVGQPNFR